MLGSLFKGFTAVVSTTYDLVADATEYVVEDIKSIPDSIEEGWNEGLIDKDEEPKEETKVIKSSPTPSNSVRPFGPAQNA